MAKQSDVYKCELCGNIVEVKHAAGGTLTCCKQPMDLQEENTQEAATEKHIPLVRKIEGGYEVTVGEVEHPMTDEHYIEWIELVTANATYTQYLKPGEKPLAIFKTDAQNTTARAYCNLHGHWKSN